MSIAAAAYSSFCVSSDGKVFAWGKNDVGQLGSGDTVSFSYPRDVALPNGTFVTKVYASMLGSVYAVTSTGAIYVWGYNIWAQLGEGTNTNRISPVLMNIILPAGSNIVSMSFGSASTVLLLNGTFCYGILASETIVCSGKGVCSANDTCTCNSGYLGTKCQITQCFGILSNVTASVCSGKGTCVAYNSCYCNLGYTGVTCNTTIRGYVYTIGDNSAYQVGDREQFNTLLTTPTKTQYPLLNGNYITQIVTGCDNTLALSASGDVYSWGTNTYGTLGRDPTVAGYATLIEPTLLTQTGMKFSAVSTNFHHTALIDSSGYIYTLGWGASRYSGAAPPFNYILQCQSGATVITCTQTSCVCNPGEGARIGNLGNSSYFYSYTPLYVPVPGNPQFTQVSAGLYHTVAVTTAGVVYGFGRANEGQIGDGMYLQNPASATKFYLTPYAVAGAAAFGSWMYGRKAVAAKAGDFHTLVLLDRGDVVAFGLNNRGQIGDGTYVNRYLPVLYQNSYATPVISISAGSQTSFLVTSTGTVLSFGANYNTVLGLNRSSTIATVDRPVAMPGITNAYMVHTTYFPIPTTSISDYPYPYATTAMILTRNGSLYGTGSNLRGMQGDGTATTFPWVCMYAPSNNMWAPVSTSASGDAQCLTNPSYSCYWESTQATCNLRIAQYGASSPPLVCGPQVYSIYGITGYETPTHWCYLARALQIPGPSGNPAPVSYILDKPTRYAVQMSPSYRHSAVLFTSPFFCYNILPDDPAACGYGRGSCVANNTCVCRTGYSGADCTTPSCFGVLATSNKTCSGNGFCTEVDFCLCYPGYSGLNCSTIPQDYVFAAGRNDIGQLGDGPLSLTDRTTLAQSQLFVRKTYNFVTGGDNGVILMNIATGEIGMFFNTFYSFFKSDGVKMRMDF